MSTTDTADTEAGESRKYLPDEALTEYMRKRVKFEKRRIKQDLRLQALQKDSDYNSLRKRKARVIDIVFKSMANLLFFFECLANIPSADISHDELEARKVIRESFRNDVKDLLGIRRTNPDEQTYGFLFDRLIYSIIYTGSGRVDNADYFRLKLIHILQQSIFFRLQTPLTDHFSGRLYGIVMNDIGRGLAWTEMLAGKVDTKEKKPDNIIDFSSDLLLKDHAERR